LAGLLLGGVLLVYSGVYNVAAVDHHSRLTFWLLRTLQTRSVKLHAAKIMEPPGFDNPINVVTGTEHFAAHCAVCHGAPGVPKDDMAEGMYPSPPDLAETASRFTPAELFWIVKNGLKMTAMPSWSDHGDDDLWAIVAFLKKLPHLSEADYTSLVQRSRAREGPHAPGG
jgi:cytochrome c